MAVNNVGAGLDSRIFPKTHEPSAQLPQRTRLTTSAPLDFIPSPESLATIVADAVTSLRHGHYWDRGSILNILA